MAKDPNQRFASMADFQEALRPGGRVSTGSTAVSTAPARIPDQVPVQRTVAPASDPSTASWVEAPVTTLSSTMGQVAGETNRTWRPPSRARRTVLVGGVLVAAALAVVAIVALRGRQSTSAASITPVPAPVAVSVVPPTAPVAPSPDAAPSPTAAHTTIAATEQSQPVNQKATRPEKTGAKKNAKKEATKSVAVVRPEPLPLPEKTPQPPPPQVLKKVERW